MRPSAVNAGLSDRIVLYMFHSTVVKISPRYRETGIDIRFKKAWGVVVYLATYVDMRVSVQE